MHIQIFSFLSPENELFWKELLTILGEKDKVRVSAIYRTENLSYLLMFSSLQSI